MILLGGYNQFIKGYRITKKSFSYGVCEKNVLVWGYDNKKGWEPTFYSLL